MKKRVLSGCLFVLSAGLGYAAGPISPATFVNQSPFSWTNAAPVAGQAPALCVVGRRRYADAGGIEKDGKIYVWQEMEDALVEGKLASKYPADGASRGAFLLTMTAGQSTCKFKVPKDGDYFLFLKVIHHGNTNPQFGWTLNGKEMPFCNANFGWNRIGGPVTLGAGEHAIVFQEAGKETTTDPSNRLMAFDVLQVTTDPNPVQETAVRQNPQDLGDKNWLPKPFIPLTNPTVTVNGSNLQIQYTFEEGEPVLIFQDGQAVAARSVAVTGKLPPLAGATPAMAFSDPATSSHHMEISFWPGSYGPAPFKPSILTPNGDGVDDEGQPADAPAGSRIEILDPAGSTVLHADAGRATAWNGCRKDDAVVAPGFYIAQVRNPAVNSPLGLGVMEIRAVPPLIEARPRIFSPNGDTVWDSTTITFSTPAAQPTVEVEGRNVKFNLPQPQKDNKGWRIVWNGLGPDEKKVADGSYRVRVLDGDRCLMSRRVEVNTSRQWPAIANPYKNWFPLGIWTAGVDEQACADLLAHGLDTIFAGGDPQKLLPLAEKHNLRVIAALDGAGHQWLAAPQPDEFAAEKFMQNLKAQWAISPAFAGYYFCDEPMNNPDRAERLHVLFRVAQGVDPAHPPLMALIGTDRIQYYMERVAQPIAFFDIYPLRWDAKLGDFHSIYYTRQEMMEYLDDAAGTLKDEKEQHLWIIAQTHAFHGWHRQPIPAEIRQSCYLDLAAGGKALFFFFYQTQQSWIGLIDRQGQETDRYREVAAICKEVKPMAPTLLKLVKFEKKDAVEVTGGGSEHYDKGTVRLRYHPKEKKVYLFMVNRDVAKPGKMIASIKPSLLGYRPKVARNLRSGKAIPLRKDGAKLVFESELAAGDGWVFKLD